MIIRNVKLKASSLSNTILLCLIISIFCGSLVFVAHYYRLFNEKLELKSDLISINDNAFIYGVSNLSLLEYNTPFELDVIDTGIYSALTRKKWGFYDVLISKTLFKKDTIVKMAMLGYNNDLNNDLALYVTNYDKTIKIGGKTKIEGILKLPNGNYERAYIDNQSSNSLSINGRVLDSKNRLPKVNNVHKTIISQITEVNDLDSKNDTIINSFNNITQTIDLSSISILQDVKIKGNVILESKNPIKIGKTAFIEDALIIAPEVTFEKGFVGNAQIVSTKRVEVESNVSLKYPSSIYVENDKDSVRININSNAKIAGGIVINGNTYQGSLKRQLYIDNNAIVIGNVYCYGRTELKGTIIGSIYSDRFYLKTNSAEYENMLFDVVIDRKNLPENFIELPLFEQTLENYNKVYAVIKKL